MSTAPADLARRVSAVQERIIAIRRDLHQYPELAYQERRTAEVVATVLRELGLEVRTGLAETGVIGVLRGQPGGRTVALRADMDALPVQEEGDKPYQSRNPGVAHTCGHDVHVAVQLGVAMVLAELREQLRGNVVFIFEPAEEVLQTPAVPGAERLVAEGALDEPKVDAVLGLHVYPEYATGQVALRAGVMMTGMDFVKITIRGQEAHTSTPHKGADAIVAAAQVVTALQTLASRELDPLEAVIVHLGSIRGGEHPNILADRVEMTGTVRVSDQSQRPGLEARLRRVVGGVTAALRCEYDLEYRLFLPPIDNDPDLARLIMGVAVEHLGPQSVVWMPLPRLTGESFPAYAQKAPVCFWFLGVGNPARATLWASHHPRFDVDEDALAAGVTVQAAACLRFLEREPDG